MHWDSIKVLSNTGPYKDGPRGAGSGRVGPSRAEWGRVGPVRAQWGWGGFNSITLRLGPGYKDRPSGTMWGRFGPVGPSRAE